MRLNEFAPLTLKGSFHRSLIFNKLWLIKELSKIKDQYSTIYILGSWYGNLSLLLSRSNIEFDHIVNVDQDVDVLKQGQRIARRLGDDLDYRQLDQDGLVINTSCHDIDRQDWFDHIPAGTMVALQTRDDVDHSLSQYPLQKTLYRGSIDLEDPETPYTSWLKIGIK